MPFSQWYAAGFQIYYFSQTDILSEYYTKTEIYFFSLLIWVTFTSILNSHPHNMFC